MQRLTDSAVEQLGGTSAIAAMVHAPVSTVHSWRRKGISASRFAHLKLAAQAAGKHVDWSAALEAVAPDTKAAA